MQPLINPTSFVEELRGDGGQKFEAFVRDLVRNEATPEGIPQHEIVVDYRTNVGDQGIDLEIRVSPATPARGFIPPKTPSIWSFKSGEDGRTPSKFKAEITKDEHKSLRDKLDAGYTFVWCTIFPASREQREEVEKVVPDLAKKFGWRESQFALRWDNHLRDTAELYPNILSRHLPKAWSVVKNLKRIDRWEPTGIDKGGYQTPLVDIAGRAKILADIQHHLCSNNETSMIHIAGLSGVGKTRLIREACITHNGLKDTFYLERSEQFTDELLDYLLETDRHTRLVIDELSLSDLNRVHSQVEGHGDQLRVVGAGPAPRQDRAPDPSSNITILAEPTTGTDVLGVVRAHAKALSEDQIKLIASEAGHDLRLAILLADIKQRDKDFYVAPNLNTEEVIKRVVKLFPEVKHVKKLDDLYRFLTVAIDIGVSATSGAEMEFIAKTFEINLNDLRDCYIAATEIGLGISSGNYFEAHPRRLAVDVFRRALHQVKPRLKQLLKSCPNPRLKRRVVERCQELEGEQGEEVAGIIGDSFREQLGKPTLLKLTDREPSRVFSSWVELDPERGLQWLIPAIQAASDEELAKFDARPDGSGGWRGRRQIVWLLEHLACFAEYFDRCETGLFRLAQVETEEAVGNNSLHTWQAMFTPTLSNTEVPFAERWNLLLKRLRQATPSTIGIVLDASKKAFASHFMRMAPPAVVGGRIVPRQWQPQTSEELKALQQKAAEELIDTLSSMPEPLRAQTARFFAQTLSLLLSFASVDAMRTAAKKMFTTEREVLQLQTVLKDAYRLMVARKTGGDAQKKKAEQLKAWVDESTPKDRAGRVMVLTAEPYWSTGKVVETTHHSDLEIPYRDAAKELLTDIKTLESLQAWLSDDACQSGEQLGHQLGQLDASHAATPILREWLKTQKALPFTVGYFRVAKLHDQQRVEVSGALDALSKENAFLALSLTVNVDVSARGVARCTALASQLKTDQLGALQFLAYDPWTSVLTIDQKSALVQTLLARVGSGDTKLLSLAIHLLYFWAAPGKPNQDKRLGKQILQTLTDAAELAGAVVDHQWSELAHLIMDDHVEACAGMFVDFLTRIEGHSYERREQSLELLKELESRHPKEVLQTLMKAIESKDRRLAFHIFEFRNLFETFPLDLLKQEVLKVGKEAARAIARHLASPSLDSQGNPVLPPTTDWLLTEFASDQEVLNAFLVGRHSGEIQTGHARDREPATRKLLEAFKGFKQPWIQRWIKNEERELAANIAFDDRMDEKLERE